MTRSWNRTALVALALGLSFVGAAHAGVGQPSPWQIGMQEPVTEVARDIGSLHTALVWIITIISLFVLGLLIAVIVPCSMPVGIARIPAAPSRRTTSSGRRLVAISTSLTG